MNIHSARENMLKQQIRACEVLDDDVLALLAATPREAFVPHAYRHLAFADNNIPLGHEQVMMTPMLEGQMIQALGVQPDDKVLEIGTGSGYVTALLAKLGQHVFSIDCFEDFLATAEKRLAELDLSNVTFQQGNAAVGWDKQQPYDVICITGSLPALPTSFQRELKIGGRLFAIVGHGYAMEAVLVTRKSEQEWQQRSLFETVIPPLLDGPSPKVFSF